MALPGMRTKPSLVLIEYFIALSHQTRRILKLIDNSLIMHGIRENWAR
jgi:hypothetical protein